MYRGQDKKKSLRKITIWIDNKRSNVRFKGQSVIVKSRKKIDSHDFKNNHDENICENADSNYFKRYSVW